MRIIGEVPLAEEYRVGGSGIRPQRLSPTEAVVRGLDSGFTTYGPPSDARLSIRGDAGPFLATDVAVRQDDLDGHGLVGGDLDWRAAQEGLIGLRGAL